MKRRDFLKSLGAIGIGSSILPIPLKPEDHPIARQYGEEWDVYSEGVKLFRLRQGNEPDPYMVVLYDQSWNGNDMVQPVASRQPQLKGMI